MNKKQTISFKFIYLFFILSISLFIQGFSQGKDQNLASADSLFEQKKYTESFNIYDSILNNEEKSTPRMFLRMAFIKEGLGNYTEALYFLNEYYLKTSDKNTQNKMKEIAISNDLKGYNINDKTFFKRQLRAYYFEITLFVFISTILVFITIMYKKFKHHQTPVFQGFVLILFSFFLFYLVNYGNNTDEGIITDNHAYIMSGPSSGSDLIEVVKNGHKVKIINEMNAWTAIEWNGIIGYIREGKLKKFDL